MKEKYSKEYFKEFIYKYLNNEINEDKAEQIIREIYEKGISDEETFALTEAMVESGEILEWKYENIIDKHSTGGVGDKVTLVLMPLLRAVGFRVAKMSGGSLGLTGGTADKFKSIKNMNIELKKNEFYKAIEDIGISIIMQTENLVPADKKIYDLRDRKGLVDSIPLIASSIMSKKIALGSKNLILELTVGTGAFMKNLEEAKELGRLMKKIGDHFNINTSIIITDMNEPLGRTIGNKIEIYEALRILSGEKSTVRDLCIKMVYLFMKENKEKLEKMSIKFLTKEEIAEKIDNGTTLNIFLDLLKNQGVSEKEIENILERAKTYDLEVNKKIKIYSKQSGIIEKIDARKIAELNKEISVINGKLDYESGIYLEKLSGEIVKKGELLGIIYTNKEDLVEEKFIDSYVISNKN